jgi:hypothetical protein
VGFTINTFGFEFPTRTGTTQCPPPTRAIHCKAPAARRRPPQSSARQAAPAAPVSHTATRGPPSQNHLVQRHRFGRRSEGLDPDQLALALEDLEQTMAATQAAAEQDGKVPVKTAAAEPRQPHCAIQLMSEKQILGFKGEKDQQFFDLGNTQEARSLRTIQIFQSPSGACSSLVKSGQAPSLPNVFAASRSCS